MLSVVIPCYNEEDVFDDLLARVIAVLSRIPGAKELIFIDDGSTDQTWAKILAAHKDCDFVRGVRFSLNRGHQVALTAGLEAAKGDRIFMLDADLQDPPELLDAMMAIMDQGSDVVFGLRSRRQGEGIFKRATSHMFYRLLNGISDTPIPVDAGDFRLVSRRALDCVLAMKEQSRFIRGMFAWVGFQQTPLHYVRNERTAGVTKYPLKSMSKLALDAFTGFSIAPLRVATRLSYLSFLLAAGAGCFALFSYLTQQVVPGWASILLVISFLSGIQLLSVGIIGEYVGRIYIEIKARPLYFVSEDTASEHIQ